MNLKEQIAWLENARTTAKLFIYGYRYKDITHLELERYANAWLKDFGEPHPLSEKIVRQNQDWMLEHLKDIASELELEGDAKLWDSVQDLDES